MKSIILQHLFFFFFAHRLLSSVTGVSSYSSKLFLKHLKLFERFFKRSRYIFRPIWTSSHVKHSCFVKIAILI
jgi:hypothetical protein